MKGVCLIKNSLECLATLRQRSEMPSIFHLLYLNNGNYRTFLSWKIIVTKHTRMYTQTFRNKHTHTHIYAQTYTHTHTQKHTYTHSHTHTFRNIHTHTRGRNEEPKLWDIVDIVLCVKIYAHQTTSSILEHIWKEIVVSKNVSI